jgi:cytosine/adenosine deaminase-related metal-dependent hydrolase
MVVYTATHVLPVSARPLRDAAVAVEGDTIAAVGPREPVLAAAGNGCEVRRLGRAAVLPGLVNAHCHVELSWLGEDRPPGGDAVAWVRGLLARRAAEDATRSLEAARRAIATMVARGTVALADVANADWVAPLLAESPLFGILFHEIYGPRAADAETLLLQGARRVESIDAALARAGGRWRVILAPHAPHTTSEPLLRALAGRSAAAREPVSIHVAESAAEVDLLRDGCGDFAALFRERGGLGDAWRAPGATPVEQLDRLGLLTPRTLAVHCVRLLQQDVSRLQARGVRVVTCPRSNAYLGVGRAPLPQLLGRGIPVALGTDSLASAPDLDLFAEMAALRREHPGLTPAAVLRMATLNGAAALGLDDRLGSIERGKLARLLVVPLANDEDPLAAVCGEPAEVFHLGAAPFEEARA